MKLALTFITNLVIVHKAFSLRYPTNFHVGQHTWLALCKSLKKKKKYSSLHFCSSSAQIGTVPNDVNLTVYK